MKNYEGLKNAGFIMDLRDLVKGAIFKNEMDALIELKSSFDLKNRDLISYVNFEHLVFDTMLTFFKPLSEIKETVISLSSKEDYENLVFYKFLDLKDDEWVIEDAKNGFINIINNEKMSLLNRLFVLKNVVNCLLDTKYGEEILSVANSHFYKNGDFLSIILLLSDKFLMIVSNHFNEYKKLIKKLVEDMGRCEILKVLTKDQIFENFNIEKMAEDVITRVALIKKGIYFPEFFTVETYKFLLDNGDELAKDPCFDKAKKTYDRFYKDDKDGIFDFAKEISTEEEFKRFIDAVYDKVRTPHERMSYIRSANLISGKYMEQLSYREVYKYISLSDMMDLKYKIVPNYYLKSPKGMVLDVDKVANDKDLVFLSGIAKKLKDKIYKLETLLSNGVSVYKNDTFDECKQDMCLAMFDDEGLE